MPISVTALTPLLLPLSSAASASLSTQREMQNDTLGISWRWFMFSAELFRGAEVFVVEDEDLLHCIGLLPNVMSLVPIARLFGKAL